MEGGPLSSKALGSIRKGKRLTEEPNDQPLEEYSREDLDRIFKEAVEAIERLHKVLSDAAEDAGVARQVIIASLPRYSTMYGMAEDDSSIYPIVASGIQFE